MQVSKNTTAHPVEEKGPIVAVERLDARIAGQREPFQVQQVRQARHLVEVGQLVVGQCQRRQRRRQKLVAKLQRLDAVGVQVQPPQLSVGRGTVRISGRVR